MKKIMMIALNLVLVAGLLVACSPAQPAPQQEVPAVSAPDATATLAPLTLPATNTPEPRATTYKESMLPFDQLVPGKRVVLLQNTINYGREGFYTKDTKPTTQEIEYAGNKVAAYPMTYAIAFLKNGLNGDLKIVNNDGSESQMSVDKFTGLFIIIDFTSDLPPVLYNPETGAELTDFLYAVTPDSEAIYSIVSGSNHNTKELLTNVGWNPEGTYRYVATDKFYVPVGAAEVGTGELRGALSGAINGSFPDLTIAQGKINDVLYVEEIVP